jgi:hypothetical protein
MGRDRLLPNNARQLMRESTWRVIETHIERGFTMMGEPVPAEEIESAATTLGVNLDPDYIDFVRRFGGGGLGSYPIFGLRPAGLLGNDWSFVEQTLIFRSIWSETAPLDWYIFSDSNGNPIGQSLDHRVWAYYFDSAYEPVVCIAKSFADFVERVCLELPPQSDG